MHTRCIREILCKVNESNPTKAVGCKTLQSSMKKNSVLIISPALANANNGNWQTAWRWSRMLATDYQTTIAQQWNGAPFDVMLALHARRSASSIAGWASAHGATRNAAGLAVVLTGTDLYRDIQTDKLAQKSLDLASRLVILQERGPDALPQALRAKTTVIFQSTGSRRHIAKAKGHLRAVMVGHLRDEKSPQTLYAAARLLTNHLDILIDHIGDPLDDSLAEQARATALDCPNYRWLGGLPHEDTRRRIQRSHVLVHASRMEGGAHVVMEAVCSGTPVLASRIDGNVGMLGAHYPGYFACGDAQGLADLLVKTRTGQMAQSALAGRGLYDQLRAHCAARAPLFDPKNEQAALLKLVRNLLK